MPNRVAAPATAPRVTAKKWYVDCDTPTPSVHALGISSPTTCPISTARMPKWKIGEAILIRGFSYS